MKTQAMGWLAAGVLAAGLNASYHDGGLQWAHRVADRVEHRANLVLALATGRAHEALTEATWMSNQDEATTCKLNAAMARAQARLSRSDVVFDRFEALSDRQMARLEANRARIEAQVERMSVPTTAFVPRVMPTPRVSVCPRVRMNISRMPQVKVPVAPVVHINLPSPGSI